MKIHQDIINNNVIGGIGGSYAAYYALADTYYNTQVTRNSNNLTRSDLYIKENPHWEKIVTFDPEGLDSPVPTIASTKCCMNIPEISNEHMPAIKIAIEQVWSIKGISERLNIEEEQFRQNLHKRVQDPKLLDYNFDTYLSIL